MGGLFENTVWPVCKKNTVSITFSLPNGTFFTTLDNLFLTFLMVRKKHGKTDGQVKTPPYGEWARPLGDTPLAAI